MMEASAARAPERTAVQGPEGSLSWLELLAWVQARADELRGAGVAPGDAVATVLPNSPEFLVSFFAATSLGAAAVPLNPALHSSELAAMLAGCPVRAIVCDAVSAEKSRSLARALPDPVFVRVHEADEKLPAAPLHARPHRPVAAGTPALHGFSSGTTGTPKRIVRTHGQLCSEADNFCASVGLGPDDVLLGAVPFFHAHGLGNCVLAAVRSGARLVLPRSTDRQGLLRALEGERVTVLPAVPMLLRSLAARETDADLSSLRLCFSAGTPLPAATALAFRERFGCEVRQLYGCTEAGSVCIDLDPDVGAARESVGRPLHNVEIAVRDASGQPCPTGSVGEIVLRSPAAGSGYAGLDDLNREVFVDGWFRTGDLGSLDEAGRLTIRGRIKLFIDTPGGKVDPVEIERCAGQHPAVVDAGAVGVPSRQGGELVKLVVAVDDDWTGEPAALRRELVALCREQLAEFKLPRVVELRRRLPRNAAGKLVRARLVDPEPGYPS